MDWRWERHNHLASSANDILHTAARSKMQNIKFQAPNLRVSGVGCQVSGKRNIEAEH
jgi:hypothetical protein